MEDIFIPVFESAMIYASHYCKATGRDTVTATDIEYGLKYAARNTLGNKIGTFFPDIYEEEEDSEDEEEIEIVPPELETPFSRYQGTEELYVKMNECYDSWEEWVPETPAEILTKNAIDSQRKNNHGGIFEEGVFSNSSK